MQAPNNAFRRHRYLVVVLLRLCPSAQMNAIVRLPRGELSA
jgi:hypothetical protein